jgi:carboxymethylenebutenolidase
MGTSDDRGFLDFLADLPAVAGSKHGVTGYCMGGRFALTAAAHYPDRFAAAASFHGGNLVTDAPDSPHRQVGTITAQVYVAGAKDDDFYTPQDAKVLEDALVAAGVDHTIEIFDAPHGFTLPDAPSYNPAADARHWSALEELFAATLRS